MSGDYGYWSAATREFVSRRRFLGTALALGGGVAGAALIGCSSGSKTPTSAKVGAPSEASSPTTLQPKSGGVWRTHNQNDLTSIDGVVEASGLVMGVTSPVYSRLLMWKSGPGIKAGSVLQGDAAQSWESPDRGKTWTIKLRENVKFHPKPPLNGRLVDSEDVKTSLERHLKVSPSRQTLQRLVERVETPDKNTVQFHLKESYAPFPEILAWSYGLLAFSKEANAGQLDTQRLPGAIGSGPWMWKERTTSVAWEFERNPTWHIKDSTGRQLPYMAGWRTLVIPEYAQILAQFAAGQLSTFQPNTDDAEGLISRVPKAQVFAEPVAASHCIFAFHQETPSNVMRDVRLRRAWSMAIDKKGLLAHFGQFEKAKKLGYQLDGGLSNPPIPYGQGMEYWYLDPYSAAMGPAAKWFEFNPPEAKKLVQAAGYDGHKMLVHIPGPAWIPTLEAQIPMLKDVGFNPQINVMEYSQFVSGPYAGKGTWEACYNNVTTWPNVDESVAGLMTPGGLHNESALDVNVPEVPKLYELIRKLRSETNNEARREIVYDIQRLSGDQMWYVPGVNGRFGKLTFTQANVRGYGQYKNGDAISVETYPYYWFDS